MVRLIAVSVLVAILLSACGGSEPTPTPAPTRTAIPTWTATPEAQPATVTPVPVSQPAGAATATATTETFSDAIGAAIVNRLWDDALVFVLANGTATVTADQLTAGLLGLLQRLSMWVGGEGGETALADCRAVLPGVIARSDNHALLDTLLAACESGDRAAVAGALAPLSGLLESN